MKVIGMYTGGLQMAEDNLGVFATASVTPRPFRYTICLFFSPTLHATT